MLVYDVTSSESFDKVDSWRRQFLDQVGVDETDKFPFILIGNKIDKDDRQVRSHLTSVSL